MAAKSKRKERFINITLLIASIFLSLLLAEGISRIFLDPIDYLKPIQLPDEILRLKIEPNSGAHDSWGYRNKSVPNSTDIVAIGDSHTYGISATSSNSWPSVLERLTGKGTYNLSLGGYGPVEYFYLLENKAFKLHPTLVIVGLYLGNDFSDAYKSVYSTDYWKSLRRTNLIPGKKVNMYEVDTQKFGYKLKQWLPGNSVLYRLISSSVIGDELRNLREIYSGEEVIMFKDTEHNISTGFTPSSKLGAMNLNLPEIQEGLRISLDLIKRMSEICKKKKIAFLVLLIPTKESVHSDFIKNNRSLTNSETIDELIRNENELTNKVKTYLKRHNIDYVEVLAPLRDAAADVQLYPNNFGGHANKHGYEIIARTIRQSLSEKSDE